MFLLALPLKRSADSACLCWVVDDNDDYDDVDDDDDDDDNDNDYDDDDEDNDDDDDDEKHLKKGALTMRVFAG